MAEFLSSKIWFLFTQSLFEKPVMHVEKSQKVNNIRVSVRFCLLHNVKVIEVTTFRIGSKVKEVSLGRKLKRSVIIDLYHLVEEQHFEKASFKNRVRLEKMKIIRKKIMDNVEIYIMSLSQKPFNS